MGRHGESSGDDPGYSISTVGHVSEIPGHATSTTAQKLVALAEAEQRVKELREALRADYECVRALFGRVRKAKPDKPKPGRPKGSKNARKPVQASYDPGYDPHERVS